MNRKLFNKIKQNTVKILGLVYIKKQVSDLKIHRQVGSINSKYKLRNNNYMSMVCLI